MRQNSARRRRNWILAIVGLVVIVAAILVITGNLPGTQPASDQNTPVATVPTGTSQPATPTPTLVPSSETPTGATGDVTGAEPTSTPTARPGPYGYLDLVWLPEEDLAGFVAGDLAATGVDPTQFSVLGIQVLRTDLFYNYDKGETLIVVLAGVPEGLGQLAVNLALGNPNQVVSLASGFVNFAVQEIEILPDYEGIGDISNGGSAVMESEGVVYPMNLGAFRNGDGMVAVIAVYPEGAQPSADVPTLLRTLDQRLIEARAIVE